MAHEIDTSTGTTAMAYAGKRPWHGLGTQVKDVMTAREALLLGGLDWTVSKRSLFTPKSDQNSAEPSTKLARHFATVRQDTNAVLGVVGSNYRVVQNAEALSFFDSALGQGAACIETVGALNRGRRVFMLAKIPELVEVVEGDPYEQYLLFSNAHDGTSAVTCAFTPVRVVCSNTLSLALKKTKRFVKIRHTGNVKEQLEAANTILSANKSYWQRAKAALSYLAKRSVKRVEVKQFVADLFPGSICSETGEVKVSSKTRNRRNAVEHAFENSPGSEVAGHTAYGLIQGVTWWLDHERRVPKGSNRWESSIAGSGSKIRQRAFDLALSM